MDPQFWLEKWENRQIGFHLDTVNPILQRHWPVTEADQRGSVFVPLCGKSLDLIWLRRQGHSAIGVELSPLAVEQFFAENGLQPSSGEQDGIRFWEADGIRIFEGDFFALAPGHLPATCAVYDRAALIAMPPEHQPAYAAHLYKLSPTPILLITLEYTPDEMTGPPFSTPGAQVKRVFGQTVSNRALESRDVLADNPVLQARGLTALRETAWRLTPRQQV
jgi:thiopurine S-methyltransferase